MDLSLPLPLFLSLVEFSSSSRRRRRALARAVDTATRTNPIPRPTRRSRAVGRARSRPTTRGLSRVATRRPTHRSIGRSDDRRPSRGARDGTTRAARAVVRTSGLSFGRLNDGRVDHGEKWKMENATRVGDRGVGCRTLYVERGFMSWGSIFCTVAWGMGWGVYGDGHRPGMVWWCVRD